MRATHEIYKYALAVLLALAGGANVWGQAVTGDKYPQKEVMWEAKAERAEVNKGGNGWHNNKQLNINAIINGGSYADATWWKAGQSGEVVFTVTLSRLSEFKSIWYDGGRDEEERPQTVSIYTSTNGREFRLAQTFDNLSINTEIHTFTFDDLEEARYVRFEIEPFSFKQQNWPYNNYEGTIAIDEIKFYLDPVRLKGSEKIQHKPAKWFDMRSGSNFVDTFDDETDMITSGDGSTRIQAAHTYVDTLYVKKGSQIELLLPTLSGNEANSSNSAEKYLRWYNYLTEGTFATGLTKDNQVNDLLTPMNDAIAYRFTNGYVGGSGWVTGNVMSGAYFYYPNDNNNYDVKNGSAGNDYYVVACDVSGYTDFTEEFTSGQGGSFTDSYTEPTLSLRVIYYIVGIDEDNWGDYLNNYDRLNTSEYQGGTNTGNEKYLEEYEITFPCDHISNHTSELVAIARNAEFYRVPGDNNGTLNVSLAEGWNSVIQLETTSLTGNRIISFRKAGADANATWSVDDGETATILVTKQVTSGNWWNQTTTTYNIARFKLTFKKNTRLLTQHQIDRLDRHRKGTTTINNESWYDSEYLYRTPDYLENGGNYILLTSRTFDYDQSVASEPNIQNGYYPYPLSWDFSSYAFFDGSTSADFYKSVAYPEWGSYGIVRNYIGYGDYGSNVLPNATLGGRTDGYFIYVDASSRPGQLVTLPFQENLCAGSELLVSAWVKSSANSGEADAVMLFTIYGVDAQGNRTPIHCQSTGQIRKTTHFSTSYYGEYTSANGYGSSNNDWYQVFLSFVNDDPSVANFDSYELRVDNNCASTTGGDYYLDDIRVYISKPLAQVRQLETACTTGRTLMNLQLDWERLMARVGGEHTDVTHNLAVCFIDTLAFHNAYDGTNIVEAIKASAVELGQKDQSYSFRVLNYNTTFSRNNPYDPDNINLASNNGDAFYGHTMGEDNMQALAVDFYGSLTPGRTYWITLVPDVPESEITTTDDGVRTVAPSVFSSFYADACAITADFLVTGNTTIKVDGEIVTPKTEFCRGNVSNFSIDLQIPDLNSEGDSITITEVIYFDWFFGEAREGQIADPLNQYTEKVRVEGNLLVADADNGVSMQEALVTFRNTYPNATDLSETDTPVTDEFTQAMYNLIDYYLHTAEAPEGAVNRTLVLHQSSLNITLLEALRVVVQPIPMSISTDDLEDWGYSNDAWMALCWGYTYLELTTTNEAPSVYPGFNTVQYPAPEDLTNQSLRIGLKQIESVSTSNRKTLTIDLREAKSYKENKTDFTLQLIGGNQNPDETYNKLFLTDTDDPVMLEYIKKQGDDFDQRSLPIGVIHSFNAQNYEESSTTGNEMKVQFILEEQNLIINGENQTFTFVPREGYYYTFRVYFEEQTRQGEMTACYGRFPVTMKVVPEYLVWNDTQRGTENGIELGNWNNDANWKRATDTDIKANGTIKDYQNDNRAFVPMLFSKVVIPSDSKVKLYAAGYGENGSWDNQDRPLDIAEPTQNIQYDLMVYEHPDKGLLKTERYRVALCDEIHFEPGAEMLYAEYLLYNKAWVDYELKDGRWYTLASPLQGVVAGDFYAPTTGRQETEYFQPINFDTPTYNRFHPSVYQRGWKNETTKVKLYTTDGQDPENVAIAGNWSSLYNDVAEPYAAGTGFSLKVLDLNNTNALFRLPKADEKYYYFNYNNGNPTQGTDVSTIDRGEDNEGNSLSGRLMSDKIYHRTETNTSYNGSVKHEPFTVELSESANGDYYLVGNPFMAHLDMKEFLKKNESVLDSKYWYVDDGTQNIAVTSPDETTWTTSENAGLIPPLRSFFVKKKDESATSVSVTFTHDMQRLGDASTGESGTRALRITATNAEGKMSRAMVAADAMASDDYRSAEDAELFLDSNLGDVPMVYTVAGTMATSINLRTACERVPLGVYGARDEEVTLRFEGTDAFSGLTLYDARTGSSTALREGAEARVRTNDYGRYYLTGGVPTGAESVRSGNGIEIYSVRLGEIVVTSMGAPLREARVYGVNGALVTRQSLTNQSVYRLAVPGNAIYMIYAEDAEGIIRNVKMRVR